MSTRVTSTIEFIVISYVFVHMQTVPQLVGGLSAEQNVFGDISWNWDSGGDGGNVNKIPPTDAAITELGFRPEGAIEKWERIV